MSDERGTVLNLSRSVPNFELFSRRPELIYAFYSSSPAVIIIRQTRVAFLMNSLSSDEIGIISTMGFYYNNARVGTFTFERIHEKKYDDVV